MATYALYTASFGSTYANDTVKIFDQNNNPAIVMASASGGVLSRYGIATLDGSGNLSVYLDNSITATVSLFPVNQGPVTSSSTTQESTQLLVKTAVQTIATNSATEATAANQTSGNTSLATIATRTPALGAATTANSVPVNIASDQNVPVIIASGVSPTDRSGKITTGGTAQSLMSTNASRRGFWIQNQSSGDLWFNELGTAIIANTTPQSVRLAAGAFYESSGGGATTTAISIIGATTGQAWAAREW